MNSEFERVRRVSMGVDLGTGWTPEDVARVFQLYFEEYTQKMKRPHPRLKAAQIQYIANHIGWFISEYGEVVNLDPPDYPSMIDRHFSTIYNGGRCDFNIIHFFTGDIRAHRFYEAVLQKRTTNTPKWSMENALEAIICN